MKPATTDDLRALLGWVDGWPTEGGHYAIVTHRGESWVATFTGTTGITYMTTHSGAIFSRLQSPEFVRRHAPLRLETGATAQAEMALHLAGFEGGILDAVGALLGDHFALRGRVAELEAMIPPVCKTCGVLVRP